MKDIVLDESFFREPHYSPEVRLWIAVIAQAVRDARYTRMSRRDALDFLGSSRLDDVAGAVGWSPSMVQRVRLWAKSVQ